LADGQSDIGEVQSDDGDLRRHKPSIWLSRANITFLPPYIRIHDALLITRWGHLSLVSCYSPLFLLFSVVIHFIFLTTSPPSTCIDVSRSASRAFVYFNRQGKIYTSLIWQHKLVKRLCIALINVIFKIIVKAYVTRLLLIAHRNISRTQSAFIKGRTFMRGCYLYNRLFTKLKPRNLGKFSWCLILKKKSVWPCQLVIVPGSPFEEGIWVRVGP
jgi:hypothetical protein